MNIDRDLHIHTNLSSCGSPEATLPAMLDRSCEVGMKYVGITDHFHELDRNFPQMLDNNRQTITSLRPNYPQLELFLGCEAQMDSPTQCTIDAGLATQFDYVLCACNHYHLPQVENPQDRTPSGYARHYLQMVEGAIDTGFVNSITHPFLHDKLPPEVDRRAVLEAYDSAELDRILRKAAAANVAFELNPDHTDRCVDWFRHFFARCRNLGVKIQLGSDSHHPSSLGYARSNKPDDRITWEELKSMYNIDLHDLYLPARR